VTFKRQQQFLIGDDPQLAIEVGADGVHFRRDANVSAPTLWRQRCPDWLISMAGINWRWNFERKNTQTPRSRLCARRRE